MRKDGMATRNRILDAAQSLALKYGYGGMSLDDVIAKSGITKGAFFYHFESKEDLAATLLRRYADRDRAQLDEMLQRAAKLSNDPAQQLLLLIGLYIEFLESASPRVDGSLYAPFCYESGLLEASTMKPVKEAVLYRRETLSGRIREALRVHTPRIPVDPEALADQFLVTLEGAFVLSKASGDNKIVTRPLTHLRAYLALIFAKESEIAAPPRTAVY